MEKSFNQALMQFQNEIGIIKKDAKNPHFKNTYASLGQILCEVKPILSACNLILLQPINDKGVCTQILLNDGLETDFIESFIPLPIGLSPQNLGSAITYFRRYTLSSLLALEIDDDDASSAVITPKIVATVSGSTIETTKAQIKTAKDLTQLSTVWNSLTVYQKNLPGIAEYKESQKIELTPKTV